MADITNVKISDVTYNITDANAVHYTANASVSVAGATKTTNTLSPSTLFVANGLIMGGTAQSAGLVTRGICGVGTPNATTGACTKDNLYLNYDGDNNYSRKVVLGAGSIGSAITGGAYTYSAVRGDQMVSYVTSAISGKANTSDLSKVATSGSYNDLSDTPIIDSAISSTSTNAVQNKVIYTALSGKQASLTTAQLNACNSGITSSKVTTYDGYASQISGKQDKLTAGSNITISGTTISSSYTDTKNTAGSTDYGITGSPLYMIGASSQAENPQTYSSKYCYIQYGSLYSYGRRVAETYTKDSEHYIQTEAGYYKISPASSKNSDGTYNDVTILTTENIAEKGLFVPMTGTINTAMSGGIHQQIAFDVQTSSGGLTPAGGGSVTTSTRYAEAFYGEKGFEYVHYWKDPNYGTNDTTAVGSYGITYKPFDGVTNTGYYTTVDTLLNEGLNIWKLSTQGYGTNTGSTSYNDYLQYVSILPNATLRYKSIGSSSYTSVDLKNLQTKLVSGTSIKTINSKSLLGSGNLLGTDIVPKASNTKNESSVPNYGLMGMYCYYYTGGEKGYANIVNSTRGVFIRFGIFTASSNGTAKTISFDSPMSMCIGTSTVIRSAHSVSVMLVDGSGMSSNATYRNSNAVTAVSYSGFTYVNGNSETGTIRYLAIGVFGD